MKALHKAFLERQDRAITEIKINEGSLSNKQGFNFSVIWEDREYPNFISALYKTHLGTTRKAIKYLRTGEFSFYGNAE